MKDTSKTVEEMYRAKLLALPPEERIRMCCRMFQTAKTLLAASIREKLGKDADLVAFRQEMFRRLYGREFDASRRDAILRSIANSREGGNVP